MNVDETLAKICKIAGLETLDTRGNDSLDFRSIHVSHLREIIAIAHNAGEVHGLNQARNIVGGTVAKPATLNQRHAAASRNELATAIAAAEDCIDPRSAAPDAPLPAAGVCFWESEDRAYTRTMQADGSVLMSRWSSISRTGREGRYFCDGSFEQLDDDTIRKYAAEYAARKQAKADAASSEDPERFDETTGPMGGGR